MIDIAFFQASATAIPTLLIASAITNKPAERTTRILTRSPTTRQDKRRLEKTFITESYGLVLHLCVAIVGEGGALAALVSHRTRNLYFIIVVIAIAIMLLALTYGVVFDVLMKAEEISRARRTGAEFMILVALIAFIYLVVLAAIPPIANVRQ